MEKKSYFYESIMLHLFALIFVLHVEPVHFMHSMEGTSSFESHYKRIREHIDHIPNDDSAEIPKSLIFFGLLYDDNSYRI